MMVMQSFFNYCALLKYFHLAIEIGFLDSQFPSGYNGALTVVNVGIVSGFLEPDSSLTFMLEIVIAESMSVQ